MLTEHGDCKNSSVDIAEAVIKDSAWTWQGFCGSVGQLYPAD
jgi:hypothetical protein